jgi:CHAT domain-containing protein/Tfp pilus assembly protein PilF
VAAPFESQNLRFCRTVWDREVGGSNPLAPTNNLFIMRQAISLSSKVTSLLVLLTLALMTGTLTAQNNQTAQVTAAEKLTGEAGGLLKEGTREALKEAVRRLLEAASLYHAAGNQAREAGSLSNVGYTYLVLGEQQNALDYYNRALLLCRALRDSRTEAITLNNIGAVYDTQGDKQAALDYFNQALLLYRQVKDNKNEAATLNNIGLLYKGLGENQKALDYFDQALALTREAKDVRGEAATLNSIGGVYSSLDQKQKALDYFNQAVPLLTAIRDARDFGLTLNNIGNAYSGLGEKQKALQYFNQALPFLRSVRDHSGEAATLNNSGLIYAEIGEKQKARNYYDQALLLCRSLKQRRGEATTLFNLAHLERDSGNLAEALTDAEAVLTIIESLRSKIGSQDLRSSFFATVQNYYSFYVDLLMRLHKQQPTAGYDGQALQVSERGRARSLLETLAEANADIRQGIEPALLERERSLQRRLNATAQQQMKLLAGSHTDEQAAAIARDVEAVTTEFQQVEADIRQKSTGYAALTQPQPLTVKEIQTSVLDSDTLLLEYSLGKDKSYLWAVTPTSISSYELPNRDRIEALAREVYGLLTDAKNWNMGSAGEQRGLGIEKMQATASWEAATQLSQLLIAPVASQLGKKRLLIVADGALEYIPFGALPLPIPGAQLPGQRAGNENYRPLILDHEIVSLPSASTLAVLRQEVKDRKPAAKVLVILADPVFDIDDERIREAKVKRGQLSANGTDETARGLVLGMQLAAKESGLKDSSFRIPRLPGTRDEGTQILALVPLAQRKGAFDFTASRQTAMSSELANYRYVHFATHGFLDSVHPELSGIVLTMIDEKGKPQDGFLRAHEVFNLKLAAELVVLSACQTGLGKEVKGEGLVSLTRGFMYAGAPRVVVSLWNVSDQATAELMTRFYRGMLKEGLRPAAALRAAQVSLLKERRWESPFYWAAFSLQGEWR